MSMCVCYWNWVTGVYWWCDFCWKWLSEFWRALVFILRFQHTAKLRWRCFAVQMDNDLKWTANQSKIFSRHKTCGSVITSFQPNRTFSINCELSPVWTGHSFILNFFEYDCVNDKSECLVVAVGNKRCGTCWVFPKGEKPPQIWKSVWKTHTRGPIWSALIWQPL